MASDRWDRQRQARIDELIRFGKTPPADVTVSREPIREQIHAHVILPRVSDDVAFVFRRMAAEPHRHGMIEVQSSHRRDYPWLTQDVLLDRLQRAGRYLLGVHFRDFGGGHSCRGTFLGARATGEA